VTPRLDLTEADLKPLLGMMKQSPDPSPAPNRRSVSDPHVGRIPTNGGNFVLRAKATPPDCSQLIISDISSLPPDVRPLSLELPLI
jgi:hypothetical protein